MLSVSEICFFCFLSCLLSYLSNIILFLHFGDDDHESISRKEMREKDKENVDDKLLIFKSITGAANVVTQESKDTTTNNYQEAKLAQRTTEQKNMLLFNLNSSKQQRLDALLKMNESIAAMPNFGANHEMYERFQNNFKKMDDLFHDMESLDSTIVDAYDNRDTSMNKRLKLEPIDDVCGDETAFETPQLSALKSDNVDENNGENAIFEM